MVLPQIRHWVRWPTLLFVVAVLLGLVAAHTSLITPHEFAVEHSVDMQVRTGSLTTLAKVIAAVASPVGGLIILVLWCLWLLIVRRRPTKAAAVFVVVVVGWNIAELAKLLVVRHRPPVAFSLLPETGSNSFPSGHVSFTTAAVLAAYFLARGSRWQRPVAGCGAVAILVVMASRLYLGVHYPTDVLASVLVSTAGVLFVAGLWNTYLLPRLRLVPLLARFGELSPAKPTGRHVKNHQQKRKASRHSR